MRRRAGARSVARPPPRGHLKWLVTHGPHHSAIADFPKRLRQAGLRATPVRLAIMQLLSRGKAALNAQEVADRLADLPKVGPADRVTVYRTLNTLVDAGLAHKVDPGDRVFRFSLTDHAHCTEHDHRHEHPHLVCDSCGVVECLDGAEVVVQSRAGEKPARPLRVAQHDVTIHGRCESCDDGAAGAGPTAPPASGSHGSAAPPAAGPAAPANSPSPRRRRPRG